MTSLIPSSAAACLLRRPLTTSGSTSRSRGVSAEIALSQLAQFSAFRARFPILGNRRVDRGHEVRIAERLGQEIDRAVLDRAHR